MQRPDKAFLIAFWEENEAFREHHLIRGECYSLHGFSITDECQERLHCDRSVSKMTMEFYKGLDLIREETFDAGYRLLREAIDQDRSYPQHSVLVPWDSYAQTLQSATEEKFRADKNWIAAMGLVWQFIGYDMLHRSKQDD